MKEPSEFEADSGQAQLFAAVQAVRWSQKAALDAGVDGGQAHRSGLNVLSLLPWQVSAARSFKPSLWDWIIHPQQCFRIPRSLKYLDGSGKLDRFQEQLDQLTQDLATLHFGAAINERWYRKFDRLVAEHKLSEAEIRKLTRCSTVLWTPGGDLQIGLHRATTRWVWGSCLVYWLLVTLLLLMSTILFWATNGFSAPKIWNHIYAAMFGVTASYVSWWFGPHSLAGADKLEYLIWLLEGSAEVKRTAGPY